LRTLILPPSPTLLLAGPLYPTARTGLAADLAAARSLGLHAAPVCTALVAAGGGRVTDVLEVPSDSVRAQIEHALGASPVAGARIGALGSARAAEAAFAELASYAGPVVVDFVASGPEGETLLDSRGIDALVEHMPRADVVLFSRRDAELVSGGAIESLDDAQVAVQRIHRRGAQRVVVRCGVLPARFFSATEDPGGDGAGATPESDLFYDGEEFVLYEAPHMPGAPVQGAAGAFSVAAVAALIDGADYEAALRRAKAFVTDAIRFARESAGRRELDYTAAAHGQEVRRAE